MRRSRVGSDIGECRRGFRGRWMVVLAQRQRGEGVDEDVTAARLIPPQVSTTEKRRTRLQRCCRGTSIDPDQRFRRQEEEERLVFASTVGVVVGAALSLLISACWT